MRGSLAQYDSADFQPVVPADGDPSRQWRALGRRFTRWPTWRAFASLETLMAAVCRQAELRCDIMIDCDARDSATLGVSSDHGTRFAISSSSSFDRDNFIFDANAQVHSWRSEHRFASRQAVQLRYSGEGTSFVRRERPATATVVPSTRVAAPRRQRLNRSCRQVSPRRLVGDDTLAMNVRNPFRRQQRRVKQIPR